MLMRRFRQDKGVEIIEFIGMMPFLFIIAIIILYTMVAGYTMVVAASAAREAARAEAVGEDGVGAARRASPGFDGRRDTQCGGGDTVWCAVTLRLPVRIPLLVDENVPIRFRAEMRRER